MKEGVDKLAPSAFTSTKQPLAHDIISNVPAVVACTLLHREL